MSSQLAEIPILPCLPATLAQRQAADVFHANLAALELTQSAVALYMRECPPPEVTWLFGRDGSLTARDSQQHWWGGSSIPLELGRTLMKTLNIHGEVGCLLSPATGAQIRAAFEQLSHRQALVVIIPETSIAAVALHTEDFSPEISAGRLWLAAGAQWESQLADLLTARPGLCIPQQYIRTALLEDADLAALSAVTNPLFSGETAARAALLEELRQRPRQTSRQNRICCIASSTFALWDIAGPTMARLLPHDKQWIRLDRDYPPAASPIALALAAEDCDALVAADVYRADLPGVLPDHLPWITWATTPRIAGPVAQSPYDAVLLADPSWRADAISAGWKPAQISFASWPQFGDSVPAQKNAPIAFIADAVLAPMPAGLKDFSSHGVLWDQIAADLAREPLSLGGDMEAYLSERIERFNVDATTLNRTFFQQHLILPAWRQGIARLFINSGRPVALYGRGWDDGAEFSPHYKGLIENFADLTRAAGASSALIHPLPSPHAHPIGALNRPVLDPRSRRGSGVLPAHSAPFLSPAALLSLLRRDGDN